jgi:hypothetical protein
MAVGDVYRLVLQQLYSGQKIQNSLHFRRKAALDPIQADCFALATDWVNALKTHQSPELLHTGWQVQQVRGGTVEYNPDCTREGGLVFEGTYTPPSVGVHASANGMPPQSAIVTTLRTGFAGRRRRGRFYFAGWGEIQQNIGQVVPGFVTELQNMWNAQLVQYGTAGTDPQWELGVWSSRIATGCEPAPAHPHNLTNIDPVDPDDAYRAVTETIVRPIVYGQHKRTIGVGA